jgi:hypothetical protein
LKSRLRADEPTLTYGWDEDSTDLDSADLTVPAGRYLCLTWDTTNKLCQLNEDAVVEGQYNIHSDAGHPFLLYRFDTDGSIHPALDDYYPWFKADSETEVEANGVRGYSEIEANSLLTGGDVTQFQQCFPDTNDNLSLYPLMQFANHGVGICAAPDLVCGEGDFVGTVGTYPDCISVDCPDGTTGVYPDCASGGSGITQEQLEATAAKFVGFLVALVIAGWLIKKFRFKY